MKISESTEKDYLLNGENEAERAFGRLSVTSAGDEIKAWVAAELDRGTCVEDVLMVLANYFNSLHASITGSMFDRNQHHLGRRMFIRVIENSYSKVAKHCFEEVQRREAGL
jgi:hypothetical protein